MAEDRPGDSELVYLTIEDVLTLHGLIIGASSTEAADQLRNRDVAATRLRASCVRLTTSLRGALPSPVMVVLVVLLLPSGAAAAQRCAVDRSLTDAEEALPTVAVQVTGVTCATAVGAGDDLNGGQASEREEGTRPVYESVVEYVDRWTLPHRFTATVQRTVTKSRPDVVEHWKCTAYTPTTVQRIVCRRGRATVTVVNGS